MRVPLIVQRNIHNAGCPLTSASAAKRSRSSGRVPMAAPQRSCLLASLVARGKSLFLIRSVRDINATSCAAHHVKDAVRCGAVRCGAVRREDKGIHS